MSQLALQVLLCKAAFCLAGFQPVLLHEVAPSLTEHFSFALVRLYEVPDSPFIQDAEFLLNSSPALQCNSHALQFGTTHKLALHAIHLIIQVY